jgi:two-component system OmpR family sensor kinase
MTTSPVGGPPGNAAGPFGTGQFPSPRRQPIRGSVVLAAVAAAGSVAAAIALQVAGPDATLVFRVTPGLLVLLVGLLVAGSAIAAGVAARSRHTAAVAAADAANGAARTEHLRFLGQLDHELKNPLTAIRMAVGNLRAADLGPAAKETLDGVDAQAARLASLVRDLRKLADMERAPLHAVPVDVRPLLDEVVELVDDLPEAHGRSLRVTVSEVPWPPPPVLADRDLLVLAVHNLAVNAVKYSGPGCTVELRAADQGDHVAIEVADTGVGIPPNEVDLVWHELARGSSTRHIPGHGLGLAVVRAIVTRHGGGFALRSRLGQGTAVRVTLPVAMPRRGVAGLRHRRSIPAPPGP